MDSTLEKRLARVLVREIPGCAGLVSTERLSGGASQETYKVIVNGESGDRPLCLRRASEGMELDIESELQESVGLPIEALLMITAREASVPEPEVHYVLAEQDGLGEGFIMQWLEGETLGARIVRSDEFSDVRPSLARQCGEILARIHAIDIEPTGLGRNYGHKPQRTWSIRLGNATNVSIRRNR